MSVPRVSAQYRFHRTKVSYFVMFSMKDFVDIFMLAGGIKNINDPDQQTFIK